MVRISAGMKPRKGWKVGFSSTPTVPKAPVAPKAQIKEFKTNTKQAFIKRNKATTQSFPGTIQNSQTYVQNTPGLFTQSIKGMKGKEFVEKGISKGFLIFMAED